MEVLIILFEVPAADDEAFVAGWEQARGGLEGPALLRALRDDAEFRFAEVTRPAAAGDPPGGEFASHAAFYEAMLEEGAPDGDGGVVLINAFEVPADQDEVFLAAWNRARHAMGGQQGYLGTRLHRSAAPADFRFVNVARWSSPLMFARALGRPEFQAAAQGIPFPAHPALYTVVRK